MSGKSYLPVLGDRGCPVRHRLILPLWCPRGGLAPASPARRALAALGGGLPSLPPVTPAFSFDSAPYPPSPLPRRGRGRLVSLFRRGLCPRHPGVKPFTALIDPAIQPSLRRGSLRFDVKPTERLSLEQCRQPRRGGDRGRGTSAFEMVLSPGAGIASAAGKSALHAPAGHSRGRLCKCRKRFSAGVPGAKPPAK